ncbi:ABC transporter family substrate-binding protein [Actinomadura rubrisoli]|uniref:ABC transporter family substrate-binding protein n=1 Tax=Actinomadura rubrisoli TaxID=2530368 RepID=A0A4R5BIF7_9ACTN|nr:ABC transporter family substrate-binding protein [Actinomadura rubrisoli]TDD83624.1 ABC transporter family substrate-binding protein [Actinomadura rubrisoli]
MSPERVRRAVAAAVLAVVAVAGSGCAGPSHGQSRTYASGRLPAYDINPVPRDRITNGGTLRWPLPEFPTQWNFNHVNGTKGVVEQIVQGALPYLMRADEKAVPHPVREYLQSAELKRTEHGQSVTYRLNPRARWSDGTPIGYRDFAAQARALSGRDPRYQVSTVTGYRQIERIEPGPRGNVVKVTFNGTYADWRTLFSPLYPAAAYSSPAAFNAAWVNRMPVTAGPFKLRGIDQTAKTVTMVRDPAWWGAPAKLDRIVYRTIDAGAVPGAFANNEIDLMDIGLDAGALHRALRVPGAAVRRAGGPDWRQFTFNAAGPILSDARVRQAVMLGIDRRAIARSDLSGLDVPVQTLGNHFYVNTQDGYQDNSGELGGYDPARARRLLDEAGWAPHGKYRAKGGRVLALRFVVPSGVPGGKQEGELARALLERVGVRVDIEPVPADDVFDRYVTPGDFDIVPFSWLGTSFPVSPMKSVFARPHGDRIQQNYTRTGTAALDAAMDRAIAEVDPAKVHVLVNHADRLVWRQASVLPLYQRPQIFATRADLANMGACGFYEPAYQDIGFTNRA